jgi:hypothetical protein
MCFSEPVSWATLAVSWTGCAALAAGGSPHARALAAFLAVVGGMQLWEALLWRDVSATGGACTPFNAAVSSAGAVTNHAEPLALWAACRALLPAASPTAARLSAALVLAYAVAFVPLTAAFVAGDDADRCTTRGPGGLVWKWNDTGAYLYVLFLATMVATLYAHMPAGLNHLAAAVTVITFTASYVQYSGTGMVGSMWCFYAAFLPWAALAAV